MDVQIKEEIEIEEWKPELSDENTEQIQSENSENCRQKCHSCDQFFENLENLQIHWASSHIKDHCDIKTEIKQEFEIKQENENDNPQVNYLKENNIHNNYQYRLIQK